MLKYAKRESRENECEMFSILQLMNEICEWKIHHMKIVKHFDFIEKFVSIPILWEQSERAREMHKAKQNKRLGLRELKVKEIHATNKRRRGNKNIILETKDRLERVQSGRMKGKEGHQNRVNECKQKKKHKTKQNRTKNNKNQSEKEYQGILWGIPLNLRMRKH